MTQRETANTGKGERITSAAPEAFAEEENLGRTHGRLHEGTHRGEGPPADQLRGAWAGRAAQ